MNIVEAVEQLKQGKAIKRSSWGTAEIKAAQLDNGQYQIFASGDLTPEMLVLLSGDYEAEGEKALIVAAAGKSPKGKLSSKIGWRGLAKKCVVLLLVLVAAQLDAVLGVDYVRAGVCVAFLCNEVISILENAGLMGVPLPAVLKNAVELLQKKDK